MKKLVLNKYNVAITYNLAIKYNIINIKTDNFFDRNENSLLWTKDYHF